MSDHFDGKRFFNQNRITQKSFGDFLKWMTNREKGRWSGYRHCPAGPPPPDRVARGKLRVTFINHATTLIQVDGVNILTDPIWSDRASPISWAGPKRARPPGIRFEDLPRIHAVLLRADLKTPDRARRSAALDPQGATREHTGAYATEEQRRGSRCAASLATGGVLRSALILLDWERLL